MALYWPGLDFVSIVLFQRARRFTCWKRSQSDESGKTSRALSRLPCCSCRRRCLNWSSKPGPLRLLGLTVPASFLAIADDVID
jgi:hypothetical protein